VSLRSPSTTRRRTSADGDWPALAARRGHIASRTARLGTRCAGWDRGDATLD
jgi:hypothetical protein